MLNKAIKNVTSKREREGEEGIGKRVEDSEKGLD